MINEIIRELKSFFCHYCILCHGKAGPEGLCLSCANSLSFMPPVCTLCARPLPYIGICGRCQSKGTALDGIFVVFKFEEPLSNLIYAYKYQHQLQIAGVLSHLFISRVPDFDFDRIDYILPVPLSKKRLLERGFNQSVAFAEAVSRLTGKPVVSEKYYFRKHTKQQAGLDLKARQQNVRNVFGLRDMDFSEKTVLLVDDVVTTGATLGELAKTLKRQGAQQVFAWALAKRC